jgi:hypothetical protein
MVPLQSVPHHKCVRGWSVITHGLLNRSVAPLDTVLDALKGQLRYCYDGHLFHLTGLGLSPARMLLGICGSRSASLTQSLKT